MKSIELIKAINEGRHVDAQAIVNEHLTESKNELISQGRDYIAQSLMESSEENDEEDSSEDSEYSEESDLDENADGEDEDGLTEKIITKVNSKGEKTKRKKAPAGYKYIDGKLTKIKAAEKLARSKGAKRGNKKKAGKRAAIKRSTAKAMKKRKGLGVK